MPSTEAEAVKLFANLPAMRVSPLTSLTLRWPRGWIRRKLSTARLDDELGGTQLRLWIRLLPTKRHQTAFANYQDVPQSLIQAIVSSNRPEKIILPTR